MTSFFDVLPNSRPLSVLMACAILAAQAGLPLAYALPSQASDAGYPKPPAWVQAENNRFATGRAGSSAGRFASAAAASYATNPSSSADVAEVGEAAYFVAPQDVAVDLRGNLYVTDTAQQKVFKVTRDGHRLSVGSGFMVPQAVAVDAAGNVFVADSQAGVIYKITPAGAQSTVGSGFYMPMGLAVDSSGNL